MAVMPNAFPAFTKPASKFTKSGKNGNLFVLILDESGSMSPVHNDTLLGVNGLLKAQRDDDIKSHIKIVSFEGGNVRTIRNASVEQVSDLTRLDYTPRGGTNLLDAVGQTINEVNEYLATFKRGKKPSVIFQITTDGEENQSRRFNYAQVKTLVSEATEAGWVFTFIGAGIDAFKASESLGIAREATSSYNVNNTAGTYSAMNSSVSRMKKMVDTGFTNQEIYTTGSVYLQSERDDMEGKK